MSGTTSTVPSNISIATNANNDIFLDQNGDIAMATGVAAVQQDCEHYMKSQFGEMWLQPADGLPNLTEVWLNKNFIKWEAVARARLTSVPGVVRVTTFTLNTNGTDTLRYSTSILTAYSPTLITVSGSIGVQS